MSFSLPKELNYDVLKSLPSGITNTQVQLLPINGASFSCATSGTIIQYILPSVGYLQPDSVYIKYNYTVVSTGESQILACPVFTPFQRSQVLFGSSIVENINNYNAVNHLISNINLDVAQKWGLQSTYGYANSSATAFQVSTLQNLNGAVLPTNATGGWSGYLNNILSNSEKLVPLGSMPSVMVQLTLDSIANMFAPAVAAVTANTSTGVLAQAAVVVPSNFTLTNVQLCYNMIQAPDEINRMVMKDEKIFIKSHSWANIQNTIPLGSAGQLELVYNTRLASIKSAFLLNSSSSTNGIYDSFDVTSNGDYQFLIAGRTFPNRPITNNDIMPQLRKSTGSIGDKANTFCIDNQEMSYSLATTTTVSAPAKFYPSVSLATVPWTDVLLSGVSTQSSPISCRFNIQTATVKSVTSSLVLFYDAIIEIDVLSKSATVKQ